MPNISLGTCRRFFASLAAVKLICSGKLQIQLSDFPKAIQSDSVLFLVILSTLPPIIMEVEGGLEDDFSLQGGHFPFP